MKKMRRYQCRKDNWWKVVPDMSNMSLSYRAIASYGDFGPWISKLVLELPAKVYKGDIAPTAFNVYCERCVVGSETVVTVIERPSLATHASCGYVEVSTAYPCDAAGNRQGCGFHIALELPECELTSRINVASAAAAEYVDNRFRVTQTAALSVGNEVLTGFVFDTCDGIESPTLVGWSHGMGVSGEYQLGYACFDPKSADEVRPNGGSALIVWLHGASDGGADVRLPYTASHVTLLAKHKVQSYFSGGAWVLVPQCPTFWMDDGVERMGRSNKSIYTKSLKMLIDEFVAEHPDIDQDRIVIGGLSNGGFMAVRMLADYPDYFAAGVGVCAPFFEENQAPEVVEALSKTPLWLVHAQDDFIVNVRETALPLYHKLVQAGAEVHCTLYDHVEDMTGLYKDELGRPRRSFGHGVWVHVFNDFCRTELDGRLVLQDGEPVSIWDWAARKHRV